MIRNIQLGYFHIIDDVILDEKTKGLCIKFNQQYLAQLRESSFYTTIDFNEYKRLTRGISARLYEILIKTFYNCDTWSIGIKKLAEKLTLDKRVGAKEYYPSDVLSNLKPAIKEINTRQSSK